MSGRERRRRIVAALRAGTAAATDPAAQEEAELKRTAARIAWLRRLCDAHWTAQKALETAWDELLAPYDHLPDEELPEIPDPPEQAAVDRLWRQLDDVRRRDLWPRHLYWGGI
jgi:hypothetical protein